MDSMIIYREVTSNTYKRIGAVSNNTLSMYLDTARSIGPANGNPNVGTYRYKIQIRDICGNLSALSLWHNTVFFINSSGTFFWNEYKIEGDPIPTATSNPMTQFDLVRDDFAPTGNYNTVGTVAGTQTTLNDPFYPAYQNTANWRVFAYGLNCNATLKPSGVQAQVVKSKSNIRNNFVVTGLTKNSQSLNANIYPNPAANLLHVDVLLKNGNAGIYIVNVLGQSVYSATTSETTNTIDVSAFESGIYTVKVITEKGQLVQKIVIE